MTALHDIFGGLTAIKDVNLRDNPLEALAPLSLQHMASHTCYYCSWKVEIENF
jgi:hypothetical protein